MRQAHHAGDKLFVDYAGTKPTFVDPATGERVAVELFVAVLGASNYTYAVEAACARAGSVAARSYRHVDSILKHGLDRTPLPEAPVALALPLTHEHVRGADYYR